MERQDPITQARIAVEIMTEAMQDDDQDRFDFALAVIHCNGLCAHVTTDAGQPISSVAELIAELESETGCRVENSVHTPPRKTLEQRHAERMARLQKGTYR